MKYEKSEGGGMAKEEKGNNGKMFDNLKRMRTNWEARQR